MAFWRHWIEPGSRSALERGNVHARLGVDGARARRRLTMGCPRRVAVLVLFAILAVSACNGAGERAGGSERPATTRECPPGSSREPADGDVVTLFHETHTHGNLATAPASAPGTPV